MKRLLALLFACVMLCTPVSVLAAEGHQAAASVKPGGMPRIFMDQDPAAPAPLTNSTSSPAVGKWEKRTDGWYFLYQGTPITNGVYKIDGKSYCFNSYGLMHTGWKLNANETISYYRTSGERVESGWIHKDGHWYYFDALGLLNAGAIMWKDTVYYANTKGQLQYGWIDNPDDLAADVVFADNSGRLAEGWKYIKGKDGQKNWYYFWPDVWGSTNPPYGMATSVWVPDSTGQYYWVDENGIWKP